MVAHGVVNLYLPPARLSSKNTQLAVQRFSSKIDLTGCHVFHSSLLL